MTPNPFYNAGLALLYIAGVVTLIFTIGNLGGEQESIFIPMSMISLLVLSVAVMGYLFFYTPVTMLLDGKRTEAIRLFWQTVGVFACGVLALFVVSYVVSG